MQKINFQNLPSTTTPINATNLNAIQTNAETAINDVADDLSDYVDGTTTMGDIKVASVSSSVHKQYYLASSQSSNYPEYYLLAKLPLSNAVDRAIIRINGQFGGWGSNRKVVFDFFVATRDGTIIDGDFYGNQLGFGWFEFKLHEASDGWYLYLRRKEQYTGEVILDATIEQCEWIGNTTASSPIGNDRETIDQNKLGHTFKNRTIPSNDLNDWRVVGSYMFDNHGDYSNAASSDGICIVNVYNNNTADWVIQEYYRLVYNGATTDKWIRQFGAVGWSAWQKIV